jgi:hypothetical protein
LTASSGEIASLRTLLNCSAIARDISESVACHRGTSRGRKDIVERTIRILIADDHAIFREGLRFVLGSEPHLEVVGEAATG